MKNQSEREIHPIVVQVTLETQGEIAYILPQKKGILAIIEFP